MMLAARLLGYEADLIAADLQVLVPGPGAAHFTAPP